MEPLEAIVKLRESSKKRHFSQTFDLVFALKDIDMKKPENQIKAEILLPKGRGKEVKVCVIADQLAPKVKDISDMVVTKDELLKLKTKKIKSLVEKNDFFFAEVSLMVQVGKILGKELGPRGKMPKPIPPGVEPKTLIERAKRSVRIKATTPTIQSGIATEDMKDEDVVENMKAVYEEIVKVLPKGRNQIKTVYLKLTMSPPVKVVI